MTDSPLRRPAGPPGSAGSGGADMLRCVFAPCRRSLTFELILIGVSVQMFKGLMSMSPTMSKLDASTGSIAALDAADDKYDDDDDDDDRKLSPLAPGGTASKKKRKKKEDEDDEYSDDEDDDDDDDDDNDNDNDDDDNGSLTDEYATDDSNIDSSRRGRKIKNDGSGEAAKMRQIPPSSSLLDTTSSDDVSFPTANGVDSANASSAKKNNELFAGEHDDECYICDEGGELICCDYKSLMKRHSLMKPETKRTHLMLYSLL